MKKQDIRIIEDGRPFYAKSYEGQAEDVLNIE
jgi:hypothetical protein